MAWWTLPEIQQLQCRPTHSYRVHRYVGSSFVTNGVDGTTGRCSAVSALTQRVSCLDSFSQWKQTKNKQKPKQTKTKQTKIKQTKTKTKNQTKIKQTKNKNKTNKNQTNKQKQTNKTN
jgi:hypothetical protein